MHCLMMEKQILQLESYYQSFLSIVWLFFFFYKQDQGKSLHWLPTIINDINDNITTCKQQTIFTTCN